MLVYQRVYHMPVLSHLNLSLNLYMTGSKAGSDELRLGASHQSIHRKLYPFYGFQYTYHIHPIF